MAEILLLFPAGGETLINHLDISSKFVVVVVVVVVVFFFFNISVNF